MPSEFLAVLSRLSPFLYQDALRHPEWLESVTDTDRCFSIDDFTKRLRHFQDPSLSQFRRRELMRIVVRDGTGLATLPEITLELSGLADAAIAHALEQAGNAPDLSIISLGKLGGRELNYSSDIDLMFIGHRADRKTPGTVIRLLSEYSTSRPAYRVDLRLRPEGSLGDLCLSLESAKAYYAARARNWELQMMIKGRVSAGNTHTGAELLQYVEPLIYSENIDLSAIEAMSHAREQWNESLAQKQLRGRGVNVKLAPGGIRDIEFLVQCLQRLHGARDPEVRHAGTLLAIERLHARGLISASEFSLLSKAYTFLRQVEHRLQLEEDRQVHTVPETAENLPLIHELTECLDDVRNLYRRIIYAQRTLPAPSQSGKRTAPLEDTEAPRPVVLTPHLEELLAQHPEYQEDLQRETEFPARRWVFEGMTAPLNDTEVLRRFFRREMFRIQVASVRANEPVFQTLDAMSALTEFVVARAYRIAREQGLVHARQHSSHRKPFQEPERDMMVVALGRLGMREFDSGSDADLVFIIPDAEAPRQQFWTRVAEHQIEILSSYTGELPALSIDSRLRPYGREGTLVQTESKYVQYFERDAEAWEGMAYMKARGVAGDIERATEFLTQLQRVDWRRYGQNGRSKQDLKQMRLRLEREIGNAAPLKAGPGAYYDADFILMYLRLKGAGLFFRSLNTPERIDIVEKMGHLDSTGASLLLEATTFFRAVDHAIRVVTGRREGKIPSGSDRRALVAQLTKRWTPGQEYDGSLDEQLVRVRERTRRLFDHVFN